MPAATNPTSPLDNGGFSPPPHGVSGGGPSLVSSALVCAIVTVICSFGAHVHVVVP